MKILTWRMGFAGDIVFSTAALEGIKKKYPESEVTYGVWPSYKNVIETNPHVDRFIPDITNQEKRKAHRIWEISHEKYSELVPGQMLYWGEVVARQAADLGLLDLEGMTSFKPQLYLSSQDILSRPEVKVAVLCGYSTNGVDARLWDVHRRPVPRDLAPHLERYVSILGLAKGELCMGTQWASLVAELGAMGYQCVQLGGRGDPAIPGAHDLRGKLTWRQSVGVLTQADLCVTIDTFVLHAAVARKYDLDGGIISEGTPTVALLGPIDKRGLFPVDAYAAVEVQARREESCPCYDSFRGGRGPCEHGNSCMRGITVDMVMEGVEKCLNLA